MSKIPTSVTGFESSWFVCSIITEQDQSKVAGDVITPRYCPMLFARGSNCFHVRMPSVAIIQVLRNILLSTVMCVPLVNLEI